MTSSTHYKHQHHYSPTNPSQNDGDEGESFHTDPGLYTPPSRSQCLSVTLKTFIYIFTLGLLLARTPFVLWIMSGPLLYTDVWYLAGVIPTTLYVAFFALYTLTILTCAQDNCLRRLSRHIWVSYLLSMLELGVLGLEIGLYVYLMVLKDSTKDFLMKSLMWVAVVDACLIPLQTIWLIIWLHLKRGFYHDNPRISTKYHEPLIQMSDTSQAHNHRYQNKEKKVVVSESSCENDEEITPPPVVATQKKKTQGEEENAPVKEKKRRQYVSITSSDEEGVDKKK